MNLDCPRLQRWNLRLGAALVSLGREGPRFAGPYPSWAAAKAAAGGWDEVEILERVAAATRKVERGEAAAERDGVTLASHDYSYPVLATLLRAAAENRSSLCVLDFGGALGSSYRQFRSFAPGQLQTRWYVVEQERFVERGRAEFETGDGLRFCRTVREVLEQGRPDVGLLSSVLQYLDDPAALLEELADAGVRYIAIDRTPFSVAPGDTYTVQHVPQSIYRASYACRVFSLQALRTFLGRRWEILDAFPSSDGWACAGSRYFRFGGLLLRRP